MLPLELENIVYNYEYQLRHSQLLKQFKEEFKNKKSEYKLFKSTHNGIFGINGIIAKNPKTKTIKCLYNSGIIKNEYDKFEYYKYKSKRISKYLWNCF